MGRNWILGGLQAVAVCCLIGVAGCAGVNHAMSYQGIPVTRYFYDGDSWRIFDDREQNRLMTTPSLGTTGASGALKGLTFGMADVEPEGLQHQKMVKAYLAETGRGDCEIIETKKVLSPQYEHLYTCPAR